MVPWLLVAVATLGRTQVLGTQASVVSARGSVVAAHGP